jgi:hypothetical protein
MPVYVELHKATEIERDLDGVPWTYKFKELIGKFNNPDNFVAYVKENIKDLVDAVAFSGSASTIVGANTLLGQELKKAGLL